MIASDFDGGNLYIYVDHPVGRPGQLKTVSVAWNKNKKFFNPIRNVYVGSFYENFLNEFQPGKISGPTPKAISNDWASAHSYTGGESHQTLYYKYEGQKEPGLGIKNRQCFNFFHAGIFHGHNMEFITCGEDFKSRSGFLDSSDHMVPLSYLRDEILPTLEGDERELVEFILRVCKEKFWF